ncbi:basic salivary proline-rich protein 2-like isoform X2 [Melanotaenia boesemani]|uniref:basic salivary proline-rich protein 2-like isoform X2 n=1 Tax=Melanotaenia boesemani TaxID=1250792 RepID=UPI001C05B2AC|nr:basic salivary proline-rich protein 2-like isoform X2 [Melanotaenia boesemani]
MASWSFSSQLILIALLSWNAYSYPTKGQAQHNVKGPSSMVQNPGFQNTFPHYFHPRTSSSADIDPGVAWMTTKPTKKDLPSPPLDLQGPAVSWMAGAGVPQGKWPVPASPEGPVSSPAYVSRELPGPPSDPQGPAVSWMVVPQGKWPVSASPEGPVSLPAYVSKELPGPPYNPQGPAVSWMVVPQGKWPVSASPEGPVSLPAYVSKELPRPPSNPQGPAVLSLVGGGVPQVTVPASSPQGPSLSWMVGESSEASPSRSMFGQVPMKDSTSVQLTSSNQHSPAVNISPSQTGDFHSNFDTSLEQGAQKGVTGQEDGMLPPLSYPEPNPQGGELSTTTSIFEHGDSEQEVEGQKLALSPYASPQMFSPFMGGHMESVGPVPNLFYLFLTGQLSPGTVSHVQTDYVAGRDHTTQVGYEEYLPATPENPDTPKTQAPMDWQTGQGFHSLKGV